MKRRRGFSLPAALIAGSLLLLVLIAMADYARHEASTAAMAVSQARARHAAEAGLAWLTGRLAARNHGRWYQPAGTTVPDSASTRPWAWVGSVRPDPTDSRVSVDLAVDEIAAADGIAVQGRRVPRLDHLRLLAIGRCGEQYIVLTARFLMRPAPLLDADTTEGVVAADDPVDPEVEIVVPSGSGPRGPQTATATVTAISARVGDRVTPETTLALIQWQGGGSAVALGAGVGGTVTHCFVRPGLLVRTGVVAFVVRSDGGPRVASDTLKQLCGIREWRRDDAPGLRFDSPDDRWALYRRDDEAVGRLLANTLALPDEGAALQAACAAAPAGLSENAATDLLALARVTALPPPERRESMLVRQHYQTWAPPTLTDPGQRRASASQASHDAEWSRKDLRPDVLELLEVLGACHDRDYVAERDSAAVTSLSWPVVDTRAWLAQFDAAGSAAPAQWWDRMGVASAGVVAVEIELDDPRGIPVAAFSSQADAGTIRPEDYCYVPSCDAYFRVPPPDHVRINPVPSPVWLFAPAVAGGAKSLKVSVRDVGEFIAGPCRTLPPGPPNRGVRRTLLPPAPAPGSPGLRLRSLYRGD